MTDARYSFNSSLAYVCEITYLARGASLGNGTHPKLIVETYESTVAFREHRHLAINVDSHRVVANKGFTASILQDAAKLTVIK